MNTATWMGCGRRKPEAVKGSVSIGVCGAYGMASLRDEAGTDDAIRLNL